MKTKTIILLVVAIVCGLVASYFTSRLMADKATPDEVEKVKVLQASKNLPYGVLIKNPEEMFVEKEFNKDNVPLKAIKTFDEVRNQRLNKALTAEQWVFQADLMDPSKSDPYVTLGPGMRAVAIRVDAQSQAAGAAQAGRRVDVICTVRKGDNDSYSHVILQNMLVLAVDGDPTRQASEQGAKVGNTVTLAVTLDQAEKLHLASKLGEICLALRGPDDQNMAMTKTVKGDDISRPGGSITPPPSVTDETAGGNGNSSVMPRGGLSSLPPDIATGNNRPKEPEIQPVALKTHSLTIINGFDVSKYTFVDRDGESNIQLEKSPLERESAPKPEKKAPEKGTATTGAKG